MPKDQNDEAFFKDWKPEDYQESDLEQKEFTMFNGVKYNGQVLKGTEKRHGFGEQIWVDGSRYAGWWQNDVQDGRGGLYYSDGVILIGEFKKDKAHGVGVYFSSGGANYRGGWADDFKSGYGVESFADGSSYRGLYSYNKKDGFGIFR